MNKKTTILGVLIIIAVCLLTTSCIFYNVMDSEEFKDHFGALGYIISDTEEALYESDAYLVASKDDVPYKIEYYEFSSDKEAKKIYKKYKDNISSYITTNSSNQETTGSVFAKVVAVSDEEYIVVSRVKNTLIFIAGTNEYANEIDALLDEIEY